MSFRSNVLPEKLLAALDMRQQENPCPAEVLAVLKSISYFQKTTAPPRFPVKEGPVDDGFRNNDWRSGNRPRGNPQQYRGGRPYRGGNTAEDGFEVWNGGGRRRGNDVRGPAIQSGPTPTRRPGPTPTPTSTSTPTPSRRSGPPTPSPSSVPSPSASPVPETSGKFSSIAMKNVAVEDRMLARVKGKMNKIGPSTYESTKVFMQQILSGDETEFLDELMKFVFQKAATESAFCSLYAKLLHELADEFTHLRTVMVALFRDYMAIFTEVDKSPDVGTSDYLAFVEAQERKKFRRGYSQFVAELVKLGEADIDGFAHLVQQIVSVIETNHTDATKTLLCEEYMDCLANLCTCASSILSRNDWGNAVKLRLEEMVKKPRSEMPGLTNKGRFALMDLVDSANRGWK